MMYLPSYEGRGWVALLPKFAGIEDGIHLVAKLTRSRIETNLADIILDILYPLGIGSAVEEQKSERLAIW